MFRFVEDSGCDLDGARRQRGPSCRKYRQTASPLLSGISHCEDSRLETVQTGSSNQDARLFGGSEFFGERASSPPSEDDLSVQILLRVVR
jgi:hypothetical protein